VTEAVEEAPITAVVLAMAVDVTDSVPLGPLAEVAIMLLPDMDRLPEQTIVSSWKICRVVSAGRI
jgi:hypothetical protein